MVKAAIDATRHSARAAPRPGDIETRQIGAIHQRLDRAAGIEIEEHFDMERRPLNTPGRRGDRYRTSAPALVRIVPFALFIAVLALRGLFSAGDASMPGVDLRWLYGVQVLAALVPMLLWHRAYRELGVGRLSAHGLLSSIVVGTGIFLLWIAPAAPWMELGRPQTSFVPEEAGGSLRWDLVAVRCAGAVLIVPVMEELFWRSFLLRWIDRRDFLVVAPGATSWFSIAATSAVFALAHTLWLAGLVAGLSYALVYRRLGNLWYAVLAHATTNLLLAIWVIDRRAWSYW